MADRPFLDQAGHERIAQQAVEANPDLVRLAREKRNFLPLIRAAQRLTDAETTSFWLAQRIGQIVRGEPALNREEADRHG